MKGPSNLYTLEFKSCDVLVYLDFRINQFLSLVIQILQLLYILQLIDCLGDVLMCYFFSGNELFVFFYASLSELVSLPSWIVIRFACIFYLF